VSTRGDDQVHETVSELLAVYALDAVDADERALVERHVEECPRCRGELTEHLAVAAALGDTGAPAPAGSWDVIAERIGRPEGSEAVPPLDLAAIRADRARTDAPRRSVAARFVAAAAVVVLVAAVGTMAWVISDQQSRLDEMETAMEGDSVMLDPDAHLVSLDDADGATYATAVMDDSGRAVLISSGLQALPEGRSYQLWAVGPDGPVSLGVLGPNPQLVSFGMVEGDATTLAITDEPAGGSPAPTSDPMVTGQMTDL
jgi:anti-sigma-K factor RskA